MPNEKRSARGVLIDFDKLKIKEQLASAPTPVEVKARQNFIENRLKRRLKKTVPVETTEVKPEMPEPEEAVDEGHIEAEATEEVAAVEEKKPATKKKTVKRRTRVKKTTEEEPAAEEKPEE